MSGHRLFQDPQLSLKSADMLLEPLMAVTPPQSLCWMVLVAGPRPNGTVAKSIREQGCLGICHWNHVGELATWAQACLLKAALFSLDLHQGFITSYLDPKAPTKTLESVDSWQIIVAVGTHEHETPYFIILLMSWLYDCSK